MSEAEFKIDLTEKFDWLSNAPIVEAVIHWRARAGKKLDSETFLENLKDRLPDYPDPRQQHDVRFTGQLGADVPSGQFQGQDLYDLCFESEDSLHIAEFSRNGLIFSRLKPYLGWEPFESEALRLWKIYCELAEPCEVQRIGVRFINLIPLSDPEQIGEMLAIPPLGPEGMMLPLKEFMHQSTYHVPGHAYNLNVIQTVRPPSPQSKEFGLILDLEVSTTQISRISDGEIADRLSELRWIKNKAFFTFLTKATIARFKE